MLTYYNNTLYHLIILKTFKNKILVRNNITENEKHYNKFSDYHTKYSSTYLKTTEIKNNKSIKMQSTNCCIKHGSRNEHTSSYKKRDNSGL